MKQKLLSILALLLVAATGAMAQTNLSEVMAAYTAQDGETLTGTLGANVKISIADGATVTLDGVTINGANDEDCSWAGINCAGDATIILKGENTVKGFYEDYPGIHVPHGKTLTIKGDGSLDALSNGYGAGIGGGYSIACGNIAIEGGTIVATGGDLAAGIGGGGNGSCGAITISDAVTKVVATKVEQRSPCSIGKGAGGSCGTVEIGGTVYENGIADSPYTYEPSSAGYTVTLADGSDAHGTVAFTVDGAAATQAKKDDVVTVSVTPNEGYSVKEVTVRAYTSWEAASDILTGGGNNPELVSDINVTKNETDGTWSFTMPEANVWVVMTYSKNLQDAWIQNIDNQTYTGSAIEPTIEVKDGETTLVANTDYTVAYTNNTEVGEATVTVTGMGNYCGTATTTFYILADKTELNNAITEAETYYNSIKDDHAAAAATLLEAVNTAKQVQANPGATQDDVENAVVGLNTAVETAKNDVATGINTVKTAADTKDATVYDLQGRRVNKPTKGLFIVNGNKVVIK